MSQSPKLRALLLGVGMLLGLELVARVLVAEETVLFAFERSDGLIGVLGDKVYVRESQTHRGSDGPYDYTIRTNSLGLRADAELTPEMPEGTERYLALGDSWIFGTSLDQEATMPAQLARRLTQAKGTPVEVVNAGIPGGSAFEALARWRELGQDYAWTGVVIGIPHNVGRQSSLAAERASVFHPTQGAPYINCRLYLILRSWIAPYTRPKYAPSAAPHDGGLLDDIQTIVSQARAQGLSVVLIEDPGRLDDAVGQVRQVDMRWREALSPLGALFAGHALNTRECWGHLDHGHPGVAGAEAIATVVASVMVAGESTMGLVPNPPCAQFLDAEGQ